MRTALQALDALGLALAEHGHQWTSRERRLYENGVRELTAPAAPGIGPKEFEAMQMRLLHLVDNPDTGRLDLLNPDGLDAANMFARLFSRLQAVAAAQEPTP